MNGKEPHRNGMQQIKNSTNTSNGEYQRRGSIPEELLQELNLPKPSEEPYKIYIIGAPQWPQVNQYILVHGLPGGPSARINIAKILIQNIDWIQKYIESIYWNIAQEYSNSKYIDQYIFVQKITPNIIVNILIQYIRRAFRTTYRSCKMRCFVTKKRPK